MRENRIREKDRFSPASSSSCGGGGGSGADTNSRVRFRPRRALHASGFRIVRQRQNAPTAPGDGVESVLKCEKFNICSRCRSAIMKMDRPESLPRKSSSGKIAHFLDYPRKSQRRNRTFPIFFCAELYSCPGLLLELMASGAFRRGFLVRRRSVTGFSGNRRSSATSRYRRQRNSNVSFSLLTENK